MMRARWMGIGMRVLAAGAVAFAVAAAAIVAGGLRDDDHPADVAVVLGNTVRPDGTPSPRLAARLDAALALYRRGRVRSVVVSGGVGREGFDEAAVMRRYLAARGVPAARIVADSLGLTTAATARNAAAIMRRNGWTSAVVVSQYFHLPRCRLAFRRAGIRAVYSAHTRYFEATDLYSIAREVVAYPAYAAGLRG